MKMNNKLLQSTFQQDGKIINLLDVRRNHKKYPRIKDTDFKVAVNNMTVLVYKAAVYRGQEMDADQIRFIAQNLVKEILNDTVYGLKNLSWEEITLAIRNAALGYSEEMRGVSISSLFIAILNYAKGIGHEYDRKSKGRGL